MKPLSKNGTYCVLFLKNSGERTMATLLLMELTGMGASDATRYMMDLKGPMPLDSNREVRMWCPWCNIKDLASHTPACPSCLGPVKPQKV